MSKIERDLTKEESEKILAYFKERHQVLYVVFALMFKGGFRRGEVVGTRDKGRFITRKYKDGRTERVFSRSNLPGLQVEDVRDGGVWVHRKGGYFMFQALPSWVYDLLKQFINKRKSGQIFDYDPSGIWYAIRRAAKAVGIEDFQNIHPHLSRHFFGTDVARKVGKDPFKVRDMMGHHDLRPTSRYVAKLDAEEKKAIAESL